MAAHPDTSSGSAITGAGRTSTCPAATIEVESAADLHAALAQARAGDSIRLSPGTYRGRFVLRQPGTRSQNIWICGGPDAVLAPGSTATGYGLHLNKVSYVQLRGFVIRGGSKGLMLDRATHNVIQGLIITGTGQEALHLRKHSSDNVVRGNTIGETGKRTPKYGEGIYVGSAVNNWHLTGGKPDRSDRNVIEGNRIYATTAESVDIKEGTTAGHLVNNRFDGAGLKAADSTVDVKGNDWTIRGNESRNTREDIQIHVKVNGWGMRNEITDNRLI